MNRFFRRLLASRMQVVISLLCVAFIMIAIYFFLVLSNDAVYISLKKDKPVVTVAIFAGMLAGLATLIANYLSDKTPKSIDSRKSQERINELQEQLNLISDIKSDSEEKSNEILIEKINDLNKRLRAITVEFDTPVVDDPKLLIVEALLPLEINIERYISKLNRNSVINLTIGIFGTLISITILGIALINSPNNLDLQQFLLNFIPKISFVIFIQLFSFFFLRLYKSNLEDSKYFQNELTNILAKSTAIQIAQHLEDKPLLTSIVSDLSKIERNFKLAAGETLLNIERTKIEKDFDLELVTAFKDILKTQKKD